MLAVNIYNRQQISITDNMCYFAELNGWLASAPSFHGILRRRQHHAFLKESTTAPSQNAADDKLQLVI